MLPLSIVDILLLLLLCNYYYSAYNPVLCARETNYYKTQSLLRSLPGQIYGKIDEDVNKLGGSQLQEGCRKEQTVLVDRNWRIDS